MMSSCPTPSVPRVLIFLVFLNCVDTTSYLVPTIPPSTNERHNGAYAFSNAPWTRGPPNRDTVAPGQAHVSTTYPHQVPPSELQRISQHMPRAYEVHPPLRSQQPLIDQRIVEQRQAPHPNSLELFPPMELSQPLGKPHARGGGGRGMRIWRMVRMKFRFRKYRL